MKRKFKKTIRAIGVIVTVLLIVVSSASPVFSVGAAVTAADFFMSMWSAYGAQMGMSNTLITGGVANTPAAPMSSSNLNDLVTSLYNKYINAGSLNQTLANWMDEYAESVSFTSTGSSGLSTIVHLGADLVEWFDHFSEWLLEDELQMTRTESGFVHSGGTFGYISEVSGFPNQPLSFYNGSYYQQSNVYFYDSSGRFDVFQRRSADAIVYCFFIGDLLYGACENYAYVAIGYHQQGHGYNTFNVQTLNSTYNLYVGNSPKNWVIEDTNIPSFSTLDQALDAITTGAADSEIELGATDENAGVIGIPDTDAQDYTPEALDVPVNVPWNDAYTGTDALPYAITDIIDMVRANELEITDAADPDLTPPSSVMPPYLPFEIPSFNFNFSGIWHYVVSWVGSIGSGLSFFSSIWSNIPYAMVVPIYAAAVIVIVTSVFKRFV